MQLNYYMTTFALCKIEAIQGQQEFDKFNNIMTREELLKDPAYWTTGLQMELYRQIVTFMEQHHMNKTQLAQHLGCSKGYVTQLLNGDYDHKLSKFIELSLAINKVPEFTFSDVDDYITSERNSYISQQSAGNDFTEPNLKSKESFKYLIAA